MRRILLTLALVLAFTPKAHADQLDEFRFVTAGIDLSFALPVTDTLPEHPYPLYFGYYDSPATLNGSDGFLADALFYSFPGLTGSARIFTIDPVAHKDAEYILYGDSPASIKLEPGPGTVTNTFLPGTYTGLAFNFTNYALAPYTITATPEANTDVTPEPASLALLATGSLGLLTTLRRRCSRP